LIAKHRTTPLIILILVALLRRLKLNHPKYQQISEELGRRQAGYQGEESMDFHYRSLSPNKYIIFHDLNLPDGEYNCQIDTLLLSSEHILMIDVKNMTGKLHFDTENEQFTQNNNGIEKGFPYPIAQGERHQQYITKLLAEHNFPPVPVDYLVVLSNDYASYTITGNNASKVRPRVSKADVFLKKVSYIEKWYSKEFLTAKDLRKFTKLLLKMNTPPASNLLKKYKIEQSDLLTGVFCPFCSHLPMIRKQKKWHCPSCGKFSKDAHVGGALKDYFLLGNSSITNQQFRIFAHLSSIYTASRMLRSANLSFSGENRNRSYFPSKFPW
jgi:hypothetical protein